jgi:hypothetical protein
VAGAAAIAIIAAAPIASAAPSEKQCLQQHCLAANAPTISQRPGNVQIVTSPQDLPAVFPHTNDANWRGLGYDARWGSLGYDPKWRNFGYNARWNGFQTALLPAPGIRWGPAPRLTPRLQVDSRSAFVGPSRAIAPGDPGEK